MNTKLNSLFFSIILITTFSISSNTCDTNIEVGFSPGNSAHKLILNAIQESKKSIDIAAYSFTNKTIALALIDAQQRGIHIRILADKKSNTGKYTALTYLANQKIPVKLNSSYIIMHNKFMIIDNKSVETGSFNYTQNASFRNAENIIYIRNNIIIANKYIKEFNKLWNEGTYAKSMY
nr:MAG: phospholipase D family protein [Candidatus Aschnera chinzeii]